MNLSRWSMLIAVSMLSELASGADQLPAVLSEPRMQTFVKRLPEVEKLADRVEVELKPSLASKDPKVLDALDGARLRIQAVRSVRKMLNVATGRPPAASDYRNRSFYNQCLGHLDRVAILSDKSLDRWKEGLEYYLKCAKTGVDPHKGMTSGTRTVRSPIDGQLLWYEFWLPKDYSPEKKYPLEVRLHSGAGLMWQATWVHGRPDSGNPPGPKYWDRLKNSPWKVQSIWIHPCGRGNNDYAWMGEVAVMQVIEDAKKHYAVDEDLVTAWGGSMGADGTCRLSALHPNVFSAVTILSGGIYPWPKKILFDPARLPENFANTPAAILCGGKDGYYKGVRPFLDELDRLARQFPGYYPHKEWIDPPKGHENLDQKLYDEARAWIRRQKPRNRWPKLVVYKTECLRYDGAYWATIDTVGDPTRPAKKITADARQAGVVRVTLQNVTRFHLELSRELMGDAKEAKVSIDGRTLATPTGDVVYFAVENGKWITTDRRYPDGLVKKHTLSGPMFDVFMEHPVLMVHATRDADEAEGRKQIDNFVRYYFGPGDGWEILHTAFDRKADKDVTDRDVADRNLVLFGDPSKNRLLARIIDRLPPKYTGEGFEIGGEQYKNKTHGLMMVYPNPLNPERYVLLVPEIIGRCTALGVSHVSIDLCYLGDYAVIEPQKHWPDKFYAWPIVGGSFDSQWRLPAPVGKPAPVSAGKGK